MPNGKTDELNDQDSVINSNVVCRGKLNKAVAFKFRYETLLLYRKHLKEEAEIALAQSLKQLRHTGESLMKSRESLHLVNQSLSSGLKTCLSSNNMKIHSDSLAGLNNKIKGHELLLAEQKKTVKGKKEALLVKARQYKIIDKLKEKDLIKWKHRQLLMEQKTMNEIAVIRHAKDFL